MKINTKDWKKLKKPILTLLTVTVLACILIMIAINFDDKQKLASQAQAQQLQLVQQQFQTAEIEKNETATFLPQYQNLIAKGMIGEEQRQSWLDALREIQQTHQLFPIQYEMGQLEIIKPAFLPTFGSFTMHKSTMKLQFDMLHEGDLLQLTESLSAKNLAAWLLRECEINRLNSKDSAIANLHAQCEIDWLTLREPNVTQSIH